jgi:sugar transferase (PEP-CTERM/EpsH1 system associated)
MTRRCKVVHVVYGFGHGGLENVIVQLINRLPADRFEHVLLSLTTIGAFRERIERDDVQFIELNKPPGHAVPLYPRIWRLLRGLRADVLHTCNLAALEVVPLGWLAGIAVRVHAEHGWDVHDPAGTRRRYQWLRRAYRPFVTRVVAVSRDIERYLLDKVGFDRAHLAFIANGVDTQRFRPREQTGAAVAGCPFDPAQHSMIGTVGRLQEVKNQTLLARAFVQMLTQRPGLAARARLVIVGDGPLRGEVERILESGGVRHLAWLAGMRDDVADVLRMLDVFVLPSTAEGMSCTLQEAMACGLAVVATAVGGTPEVVEDGVSGVLVPAGDVAALSQALQQCLDAPGWCRSLGAAARVRVTARFDLDQSVAHYAALFSGSRALVAAGS